MQRHAVPQNIMDIEFKLFGSLTVKQFTYIAISLILAVILYFSGLPSIVTYPVILFIVIIGLAAALLTVNGQPFATWFTNFVYNLFSTQRRVYHKTNSTPQLFTREYKVAAKSQEELTQIKKVTTPYYTSQAKSPIPLPDYKTGVPTTKTEKNVDDILAEQKLHELDKYFIKNTSENLAKYNLKPINTTIAGEDKISNNQIYSGNTLINTKNNVEERPISTNSEPLNLNVKAPGNIQTSQEAKSVYPNIIISNPTPIKQIPISSIGIPLNPIIAAVSPPVVPELKQAPVEPTNNSTSYSTNNSTGNSTGNLELKILNNLQANQISGYVYTKENIGLDKSEVTIKDEAGNPVRSVFSDSKGKFITTVLPNGKYFLELVKPGYTFPEYSLQLTGELVPVYRYISN